MKVVSMQVHHTTYYTMVCKPYHSNATFLETLQYFNFCPKEDHNEP